MYHICIIFINIYAIIQSQLKAYNNVQIYLLFYLQYVYIINIFPPATFYDEMILLSFK